MVSPAHIAEAEKFGMPEYKAEIPRCYQCDRRIEPDEVQKCDNCGRSCCSKCCFWIPSIALRFCGQNCAIARLLKLLEIAERK